MYLNILGRRQPFWCLFQDHFRHLCQFHNWIFDVLYCHCWPKVRFNDNWFCCSFQRQFCFQDGLVLNTTICGYHSFSVFKYNRIFSFINNKLIFTVTATFWPRSLTWPLFSWLATVIMKPTILYRASFSSEGGNISCPPRLWVLLQETYFICGWQRPMHGATSFPPERGKGLSPSALSGSQVVSV